MEQVCRILRVIIPIPDLRPLQGSLRCDVNVSVNRLEEPYGTRCEIKNLNSVKFAMVAISTHASSYESLIV